MHISLTTDLENRIYSQIESGLYNNASEVIRDALRFLETHEEWIHDIKLARIRKQPKVGSDQLERGKGI